MAAQFADIVPAFFKKAIFDLMLVMYVGKYEKPFSQLSILRKSVPW